MNFRQIEQLLEKYFRGETSLNDEKLLRTFFTQDDIPAHLKSLKSQFEYFSSDYEHNELDEAFDQKIINQIQQNEKVQKRFHRNRRIYMYSGIAASILIIMSFFFQFDPFTKKFKNTIDNPKIAYEETMKALLMVSQQFNKGAEATEKISLYNEGVKEFSKISSFDRGIEETNKIASFQEAQNKILNN